VLVLFILALVVLSPAGTAADAGLEALTESVPLSGASFAGTPAVGALLKGGPQGSHFCTASVVHSPAGNLLVTAAHCVDGFTSDPRSITFVPGYNNGRAPYGVWTVTQIITSQKWQSDGDPDDDVAFMVVSGPVEKYTGAETLAPAAQTVSNVGAVARVVGYPNGQGAPVTCQNHVGSLSATQLEFDCKGYTDGTSGGPFLTDINPVTGTGTIIGVVGGYQQGGDTPDVSYSPVFGPDVRALYQSAADPG
jgi:V8-like Glu-specific endopeptidase